MSTAAIQSRVPVADYAAIDALSISRLKELKRSPQHYQHLLSHPKTSVPLTLGTAAHVATLEPERFAKQFAIWTRRTDAGRMAPRNGKWWDAFQAENSGRTILTEDESELAKRISDAVRGNSLAMRYLETGEPEITMQWRLPDYFGSRECKGRVDWLTRIDDTSVLVGLKTARDCRPFLFGSQAAKLGYHLQHAWYRDGWATIKGGETPRLVEIVVESDPPHAVAVYRIPEEVLERGREEYYELIKTLFECERTDEWPGPVPREEVLTLPAWAYPTFDDLSDLGLEG